MTLKNCGFVAFASKAIVAISLVKERYGTCWNEKECKEDLIWYMVGEMVKNRVGQSCIFHVIIPAHHTFFLTKSLLFKLKNLHTSACLKPNYCTTKHKPKT